MASVNKHSLREEYQALKAQFECLCAEGKMATESRALFKAMLVLFELLMAVFMEKHTSKNSTNSGIPPSQTPKDETSTTQPGRHGKGPQQNDVRSDNIREIETSMLIEVHACEGCSADLNEVPAHVHERRTLIDIVFEKVATHLDAEIKDCPHCQTQTKGTFPEDMPGPLQYGTGIKAFVLNLLIAQMLSLKRVQQAIQTLIGQVISEATFLKYVLQLHQALAQWEQSAMDRLLAAPTMHVDETSLRVAKQRQWIQVYSAEDITLKFLHPKRGTEAMAAIGLIPQYKGVMIHDCLASYLSYDRHNRGLCGSHLLRELTFIVQANHYQWAVQMKDLLKQTAATVTKRKRKKLSAPEYEKLSERYRLILEEGEKELPPIPPRQKGKRGRVAKSDAHNLWERLKKYEDAVLLFAKLAHVPFTNNRAERDLRMSKVKQKISGCFRAGKYAEAYCRISSYLQTMAYKGYNPLVAIQMALSGEIYAEGGE